MEYDSTADTLLHIKRVNELLSFAAMEFLKRGNRHDDSKLVSPEKELFDEFTPLLAESPYGGDKYKENMKGLKVALDHHYANNSHHPEHYKNGIEDFDLFDLLEMFMDWKAATERTKDGNIQESIKINQKRFEMTPQLARIFTNTATRMSVLHYDN